MQHKQFTALQSCRGWFNLFRNGVYIATVPAKTVQEAIAQASPAIRETANVRHMTNR